MKKQTAVELFRQRLVQRGIGYNIKDFEEAKEMENQQRQEDANHGYSQGWADCNSEKEPMKPTFKSE